MVVVAFFSGTSSWQEQVCDNAKKLLETHNVPYILSDALDETVQIRSALHMLSGSLVYPQFFWTDQQKDVVYLGGFETLKKALAGDGSNSTPTMHLVRPHYGEARQGVDQGRLPTTSLQNLRKQLVRQVSEEQLEQNVDEQEGTTLSTISTDNPLSVLTVGIRGKRTKPRRPQKARPSAQGATSSDFIQERQNHPPPLKYLRRTFVRQYSNDHHEAPTQLPPSFITDEEPRPSVVVYPNDKRPEDWSPTRRTVRFLVANLESGVCKGNLTSFSTKKYLNECRKLTQQNIKGLKPSLKVSPPKAAIKEKACLSVFLAAQSISRIVSGRRLRC